MERTPAKSSVVASVGYDPESSVLEVEFVSGRVYRYFLVPISRYRALLDAKSMGFFINSVIKPNHGCEEVE